MLMPGRYGDLFLCKGFIVSFVLVLVWQEIKYFCCPWREEVEGGGRMRVEMAEVRNIFLLLL